MSEYITINGHPFPQYFFALYADGREERLTGLTINSGETSTEALERTRQELGAVSIVMKPQEAQVTVE